MAKTTLTSLGVFIAVCEVLRILITLSHTPDHQSSTDFMASNLASKSDLIRQSQTRVLSSYQLAYDESFGFFTDITDENWNYRQSLARNRRDHAASSFEQMMAENRPAFWYVDNYYPSFSCPNLWRIGGPGDGPKYVCNVHRIPKQHSNCLIYSVGSKAKFEFEDGVLEHIGSVCEIHVFDPRDLPSGMAEELLKKNIHFHHWGLKSSYDFDYRPRPKGIGIPPGSPFYTFPETLEKLGHVNRTIDVFKIDCEGCEWKTYKDWLDVDIRQLLLETHDLADTTLSLFDDLIDAGFNVVSREPNIYPYVTKNNKMAMEWSFLRLDPSFSGGRTTKTTQYREEQVQP